MNFFSMLSLFIVSTSTLIAAPQAYVTNFLSGSVSIVDLTTNTVTGYVDKGSFNVGYPSDIHFTSDATKAYLTCVLPDAVFIIDTSTNAIVGQVNDSSYPFNAATLMKISPDGTTGYVTNEGGD